MGGGYPASCTNPPLARSSMPVERCARPARYVNNPTNKIYPEVKFYGGDVYRSYGSCTQAGEPMTEITTKSPRGPGRPWLPGQSGNPAGRPLGSAHVLAEKLREDLAAEWAKRGAAALADL